MFIVWICEFTGWEKVMCKCRSETPNWNYASARCTKMNINHPHFLCRLGLLSMYQLKAVSCAANQSTEEIQKWKLILPHWKCKMCDTNMKTSGFINMDGGESESVNEQKFISPCFARGLFVILHSEIGRCACRILYQPVEPAVTQNMLLCKAFRNVNVYFSERQKLDIFDYLF